MRSRPHLCRRWGAKVTNHEHSRRPPFFGKCDTVSAPLQHPTPFYWPPWQLAKNSAIRYLHQTLSRSIAHQSSTNRTIAMTRSGRGKEAVVAKVGKKELAPLECRLSAIERFNGTIYFWPPRMGNRAGGCLLMQRGLAYPEEGGTGGGVFAGSWRATVYHPVNRISSRLCRGP